MLERRAWTRRSVLGAMVAAPAAAGIGAVLNTATGAPLDGRAYPTFNLKTDFDAVGDGAHNDTGAFRKAAEALSRPENLGGTLVIPAGTYKVGEQVTGGVPYYAPKEIFVVEGLQFLHIQGNGATIRLASGLHYGAFDTSGGRLPLSSKESERAAIGAMIRLVDCANVTISDLTLDGNNSALVLGGGWANTETDAVNGIQALATGIWLNRCTDVVIRDVRTHHHGLDGITILHQERRPEVRKPHLLERVTSDHNGRQGLSWIGGWGLTCKSCSFSHTGRQPHPDAAGGFVASKPGAGVDIEPNRNASHEITREGRFENCEFVDNAGHGVEAANGDSRDNTFTGCVFWAVSDTPWTTMGGANAGAGHAIYVTKPGVTFNGGTRFHGYFERVYGNSDPAEATAFTDCTIEDRPWTNGGVHRREYLFYAQPTGSGVTWTNCWFNAHRSRTVHITHSMRFVNCGFTHGRNDLAAGTYQALFENCRISGGRFLETDAVTKNYYLRLVANVVVENGTRDTTVEGPRIRWQTTSGPIGTIAPRTYPA
jgi:hypothetical protein